MCFARTELLLGLVWRKDSLRGLQLTPGAPPAVRSQEHPHHLGTRQKCIFSAPGSLGSIQSIRLEQSATNQAPAQ